MSRGERATPVSFGELLRHLDWRQELLGLALVLAESVLLYLVVGFVLADESARARVLPIWIVVVPLLAGHLLPRLMDEWRVWSPDYETIMATAIALTVLLVVKVASFPQFAVWDIAWVRHGVRALAFLPNDAARPVWGAVVLCAYAWWRGRSRAEPSIDSAYTMLRAGTVALALTTIVILMATTRDAEVRERLSVATISFFALTLAAIGVARLKLEGFRTSAPLGPRWLATFVAPILTVVVVAIVGAGIFSRRFLDTVLWMLAPVFWFLAIVFQAFVLMLAIVAFIILTPIVWLIGTREPRPLNVAATPTVTGDQSLLERTGSEAIRVPDPLRYLIATLIVIAIFSALTRFVFRRRRRVRDVTAEERESVLEWSDVLGGFGKRLRQLLRRDARPDDPLASLRGDARWRYTLAIRETYRQLQRQGAERGRARRPAETADEYEPVVVARLPAPSAQEAVATITAQYDAARYSGVPATQDEAAAVEHAFARLRE